LKAALAAKPMLAALALLWQIAGATNPAASTEHFRYERTLVSAPGHAGQACAVLDASVFEHASSESLDDLRLFAQPGATETPFNISVSGTRNDEDDAATVQDLGSVGEDIVFDAQMPARPYSSAVLGLAAKDFVGTVKVSSASGSPAVQLGAFAIFDLTSQHLSRSTTVPLQELAFPRLHFVLHLQPAPGEVPRKFAPSVVDGLTVPPSREAQTLYTLTALAPPFVTEGRDSVSTSPIKPHVPLDRVFLAPVAGEDKNFLREVSVSMTPQSGEDAAAETVSGEISHVKLPDRAPAEQGAEHSEFGLETPFAANLMHAAVLRIAVHNGDDPPLPLAPARLEMRQRKICFDASTTAASYTLMYGDATLHAPVYDYARLFAPAANASALQLGPEAKNENYRARADTRPFTERHPELLWIVLFAVIALLGSIALRSARSRPF
jgi:hypothetical protein